jgi:hypothetical protein
MKGRPVGESRNAQREGRFVSPKGRADGESPGAQREERVQ